MNNYLKPGTGPAEENEKRLRILLDTMLHGVQVNDCDGTITYSNKAHHEILGYEYGELIGKKIWDVLPSASEKEYLENYLATLVKSQPRPTPYQVKNLRKDGDLVDLQIDWNYERDEAGFLKGFISVITDITDRNNAEETLLHRTQSLHTLFKISNRIAETLDVKNVLQRAVDGVTGLVRLDTAAVYLLDGETLHLKATAPPLPPQFPEELRVAPLENHPHISKAINSHEPVIVTNFQTAELTPAEKVVAEQRDLCTVLFVPLVADTNVIGVFIVGSVGKVIPLDETDIELSSALANFVALTVRNAQLFEKEQQYTLQLEQILVERKQAEKEKIVLEGHLRQAHKMEAVGTLTGGIAHDFNNILSIILGNAELAGLVISKDHPAKHNIDQLVIASNRAKELVKRLLTFSRQEKGKKEPIFLCRLVDDSMKTLCDIIPKSVKVEVNIPSRCKENIDNCSIIHADSTQINQLLMNLCVNAVQAMDEEGTLTIAVDEVVFEKDIPVSRSGVKPGTYEYLTVSDSGHGISQELIDKIFDPFFTTKDVGKGTGMGLSVVQGIIKNHDGYIFVESKPGQGAIFHMYFPVTGKTRQESKLDEKIPLPTGMGQILYVDDEKMLADVGKSILEGLGYAVTTFTESSDALEMFKINPGRFDLVITDQAMPNITGSELAKQLLHIRSDIPIILCTGYSSKIDRKKARQIGIKEFALKPLDMREIAILIRKVLDQAV